MVPATMPYQPRLLVALPLAALLCACGPPPQDEAEPTATLQLPSVVMHDSLLFTFIQVFQIHILEAVNSTGEVVTCEDFPSRYSTTPVDPRLKEATTTDPITNKWSQPPSPAPLNAIQVPSDRKLLIVIKGLTQTQKGPHVVARGCEDDLTFKEGSKNTLDVDAKATTGASCDRQSDCELTLTCHRGPTLPGGYCARIPCSGDASCPPGTRCISDALGGTTMCMRTCQKDADCETTTGGQICEGRQGPTGGGCAEVCVNPLWNKTTKCTASGS
jgi:hypothetical protein